MARRHLIVTGRVQGVGFRWFVKETARRCELAGWVQNLSDGSVEIEVEGDDAAVEMLERAVRTGPAGAQVTEVQRHPVSNESLSAPFAVRRPPRVE